MQSTDVPSPEVSAKTEKAIRQSITQYKCVHINKNNTVRISMTNLKVLEVNCECIGIMV